MKHLLIALSFALAFTTSALADRDPTAEEKTKIEAKLKELGFVSWDEIELEEGGSKGSYWEVDDAIKADKSRFDLKLSTNDLSVIGLEKE